MRLIVARPSPFARKVRVALIEKRIDFETIVDAPWNPEAQAPALNPLGKIPILVLDDGRTIYDSRVIVEYLETLGRPPALLPAEPALRIAHKQIEALADGVCDAVVLIVLEMSRASSLQSKDWIARQRRKVEAGVAALAELARGRTYLVGDAFGLADIASGCMLGYLDLRLPDFDWRSHHPALVDYVAPIFRRPSFAQTVPETQVIAPVT